MKKNLLFVASLLIAFCLSNEVKAQTATAGTLTFSVTPVAHTGTWGAKHVLAVWVETSTGAFVKTRMRFWGGGTNDHLPNWVTNSNSNVVVAAATGATRTAYTLISGTWDGKNVSGSVNGTTVADGDYKLMIEETWSHGASTVLKSYTFTKGTTTSTITPANDANFTGVTIIWTPTATAIESITDSPEVNVYPNPTNGIVNVTYKHATNINVENEIGAIVFEEKVENNNGATKNIDLTKLANGVYFVNVIDADKASKYKVILNK